MKKIIFCLFAVVFLFVSCTSIDSTEKRSNFRYMAKDGQIVITGKSEFISPEYAGKFDRLNVAVCGDSVNGCVEGNFSKFAGKIATKYVNLGSLVLDYYQPKRGLMYFSSTVAKEYCNSIGTEKTISDIDYGRMFEADFAVYSNKPSSDYPDLSKILVLINGDNCSVELQASDVSKAKGLFTAVKATYVSYLTKNRISIDYKKLSNSIYLINDIVYIVDDSYYGFVQNFVEEFLNYGK